MIFGDTAEQGYIRGNQFIHPKLGISFTVPQGFTIDNSSSAVIANGPNDLAIRFDWVSLPNGLSATAYMQNGWVNGLDPSSVQSITINGLSAARARAVNDRWQFDVVVIIVKNRVYRFLTAAPKSSTSLNSIASATTSTFRSLSSHEISSLKPLRIHVVTVRTNDTVSSLAGRMTGTSDKEKLFRIINALSPTSTLSNGDRVKIISE